MPAVEAAGRIFDGRGSLGNGAAMRVAPIAIRYADNRVMLEAARGSWRVTHAHPVGMDGAVVQAAAVAAAMRQEDALAAADLTDNGLARAAPLLDATVPGTRGLPIAIAMYHRRARIASRDH